MSGRSSQALKTLQTKIGYFFQDGALLSRALTHRSVQGAPQNERLEFLGDVVLGHIISAALFKHYTECSEGDLSRMRAKLVCGEQLAVLARRIPLGPYLLLGKGEKTVQSREKASILAGAFEALIGAIYLDAHWDTCQEWVLSQYKERLYAQDLFAYKDPKMALQEYAQAQGYTLPCYNVSSFGKMHCPEFHAECVIVELPYKAEGTAGSRKLAEKQAAEAYLALLEEVKGK